MEEYDSERIYKLGERVIQYGCVLESLVSNNIFCPMIWDGDKNFMLDASHWRLLNGNPCKWASVNNKPAASEQYPNNGMGRVVLKKEYSFAEQLTQENTIYVIQHDFDLKDINCENPVNIPFGCVLFFIGGSLKNGLICGDDTLIIADTVVFSNTISFAGTFNCPEIKSCWWFLNPDNPAYDNKVSLQKGIDLAALNRNGIFHITGGVFYVNVIIPDHTNPYWYCNEGALNMKSNVHIKMDCGTIIKAIDNLEERYVIFMFSRIENASIEGGCILGDLDTNAEARDAITYPSGNNQIKGEYGHGVAIYSCNDITVKNCKIGYCHGDGISIGRHCDIVNYPVDSNLYSLVPHRINITNNELYYNGRQGCSACGIIDSIIKDNYIYGTGKVYFPCQGFGLDIEPNGILSDEIISNLIVENCTFFNNEVGSIMVADFTSNLEYRIHNVIISSCTSSTPGRLDLRICDVYEMSVSNCRFNFVNISRYLDEQGSPVRSTDNKHFLKFFNCSFVEGVIELENFTKDILFQNCSKYQYGMGNICLDFKGNNNNVFFNNCAFYQNNRNSIIAYDVNSFYDKIVYNNCSFVSSASQSTDTIGTHNNSVWALGPTYY